MSAVKELIWEGDSKELLLAFPKAVRFDLGINLRVVQKGATPIDFKPFKTVGAGCWELRATDSTGAYRAIYVQLIKDKIHVLHCFQKKTRKTSRFDIAKATTRYKSLKKRLTDEKKNKSSES